MEEDDDDDDDEVMIYVLMEWLRLCMLNGNGYYRYILKFPGLGNLNLTGPMSS